MSETKWYVVRALTNRENKVKDELDYLIESEGVKVIKNTAVPTEKVFSINKQGKKVSTDKKLFPGYVLIEVDGDPKRAKGIALSVDGAYNMLPQPLSQTEVNNLMGENVTRVSEPFLIGESVKITSGPFTDFNGLIEELNDEKGQMKLNVKIFGRPTPVDISYSDVEKVY